MSSSSILTLTLQQAISFLTTPLSRTSVPMQSIDLLQRSLFSSLHARFSAHGQVWDPARPQLGSEARAIKLSSTRAVPSFILRACEVAQISWQEWLFLLGGGLGLDLELYIDPGRVNVCFSKHGSPSSGLVTVWQLEPEMPKMSTKELLAYDNDDDLFALIKEKVHSPSWVASWTENAPPSPIPAQLKASGPDSSWSSSCFLAVPKIGAPPRGHSRTSSHSSAFSSGASSYSSSCSSAGSSLNGSPPRSTSTISDEMPMPSQDWRRGHAHSHSVDTRSVAGSDSSSVKSKQRRARNAPVVVDTSKASVTPYDGGKTTVMGGGVLLGAVSSSRRRN